MRRLQRWLVKRSPRSPIWSLPGSSLSSSLRSPCKGGHVEEPTKELAKKLAPAERAKELAEEPVRSSRPNSLKSPKRRAACPGAR